MRVSPALIALAVIVGLMPSPALAQRPESSVSRHPGQPALIVQITADQLRGDLLDRYRSALRDGFARIESQGFWIHRGQVDHGVTLSFPGHTTLATGMHPSHHGLTANEWWVEGKTGWGETDVSDDDRYRMLDQPDHPGASPRNLTATTIGEWVKAANPRAKSVALGSGARVAIAYGGAHADAVYWYNGSTGRFTSSTYYTPAIAPWVAAFNANTLPKFEAPVWTLAVPATEAGLANPDATPYENGGRHNTFPHAYADESQSAAAGSSPTAYSEWFAATPMKDEALLALAADGVDAERLGQRGVTDYLAIDIDATDAVGHRFGPLSLEQFDNLVRLDHALGRFLDHLDATVGKGNYVLALSADHGVADPPEAGGGGRRIKMAEIEALLDRVDSIAVASTGSQDELVAKIVAELTRSDFVAGAYTEARLAAPSADPYVQLYQRTFRAGHTTDFPLWTDRVRPHHPARYGIIVRFKENMVFDAATAIHGSPYAADRLVPIIFFGTNIVPGSRDSGGRTVDVAPTLAAAARLKTPDNLDGHALQDAVVSPPS